MRSTDIKRLEDEIFLLERKEYTQVRIRTIREAFELLKDQDRDLYKVFKTLIDEIVVHPDGTVDINYTFENPES